MLNLAPSHLFQCPLICFQYPLIFSVPFCFVFSSLFQLEDRKFTKEKPWETQIAASCGQQSAVVLHCFESQSNGLFSTSKHVSILHADQFHITVFWKFISQDLLQRERNTLGLPERFLEAETVHTTTRNANRSFLCSSEIPSWPCFPSAEKIPVQLCPQGCQ